MPSRRSDWRKRAFQTASWTEAPEASKGVAHPENCMGVVVAAAGGAVT